ncbi:Putrescine-binding periplasmic protein [Pseudomonas knackmussii B13]|uniref:Putrescine-binding periplasmic protein n=1 Tax=Pseudomonas knackmussii (strain DSM 6978 / CCUG 54928 / LMG 23759 / B13) TaxID=1301098 RepID=A0A024HNK5_PSEKB|nr:polyamine ABC transporter substrate-binding protein [Pseudomonas knackmussii]CDF86082.1 Putrescine-binding periplasmic protein [Pseudomonas knackmussii B13]
MKAILLPLLAALTLPAHAEEKILNIYSWSDYVGPKALKAFEAETGIRVHYDTFDNADVLESKLLTGHSGYDIVVPGSAMLGRAIQAKALQPIELSKMSGYENLDKQVLASLQGADPGNQYALPYTWGTTGLAINRQEVEKRIPNPPLDSYDLLFKPEYASKLKDCGISVIDSPQEVLSVALHYLGKPPYSKDPEDLRAAGKLLGDLHPNLRYIGFGTQSSDLANGNLCLALTYNGDAVIAQTQAQAAKKPFDITYSIPKEGTLMWVDTLAVPVDAPHPDAARAFIEYMMRPQSMAELTNAMFFANANQAATPMVDSSITGNPAVYPPQQVRDTLFGEQLIPSRLLRERPRLWASFRTQH